MGREVFALAKQGVLSDFSIGWSKENQDTETIDGIRYIKKAEVWEGSIVDEPMNPKAVITAVKSIDFSELDLVDIRSLEEALKSGIKFSNRNAKKLIALMKANGMLRDEHASRRDDDKQISEALDDILKKLKEF